MTEKFDKYVTKLKITGTILLVSITLLGTIGAYSLNTTMDMAKTSTDYAEKCQTETNEDVKKVYKKYFNAMNEPINFMLKVNTYFAIIFTITMFISFISSLYYLFRVMIL